LDHSFEGHLRFFVYLREFVISPCSFANRLFDFVVSSQFNDRDVGACRYDSPAPFVRVVRNFTTEKKNTKGK
jgi:hypothetical protein